MNFEVNEGSIADEMRLLTEGERWFQKHLFEVDLSLYLQPCYEDLDSRKGIHLSNMK